MCYKKGVKPKGENSNPGSRSERIPLVFGVSGHRDLLPADLPKLHGHLQQIFSRFRAAYPSTPFKLITPLAEGADRLAAEVALEGEVGLLVPLPMRQREYERDFATEASLSEFRALLEEGRFSLGDSKCPQSYRQGSRQAVRGGRRIHRSP